MQPTPSKISIKLVQALAKKLLGTWDGRECIEYLKHHDYNWRQMEWIGWYFELRAKEIISSTLGGKTGPTIGNVTIDCEVCGEPWDFKAHPDNTRNRWTYLNDVKAVDTCVLQFGSIGWVIAVGNATYDTDGSFKEWHDLQKGKRSAYENKRIERGAKSRLRKCSFDCTHFVVMRVSDQEGIQTAIENRVLDDQMQKQQRNSNGRPRRAKYGVDLARAEEFSSGRHIVVFRYPAPHTANE